MDIEKYIAYGIPDYMVGALDHYIEHRLPPGSFLSAVICNDLREACAAADNTNKQLLYNYVKFLWNEAPGVCWGSYAKFEAWIAST